MDNPNPIYYRDLITPDESITNLMDQLDELISKYEGAKQKIQGAAAEIAKGMQNVSGASEEQRKSIQLATEQSEKLVAEYRDVTSAQWKATQAFAEAAAAKKESAQIDKLITQINTSLEGSYNKLSAQYRLNKIRLNEMSQAQREGTQAGRALEAETKAMYERMTELQKATGRSQLQVGQYERSLSGLLGVNKQVVSALTDTKRVGAEVGGVFKALASPVGMAIGVIGGIVAAFKLFKDSIHETQTTGDAFDYAMAEWSATWDVFKKSVSAVDFSGFITGATEAAAAGRDLKMVLDETFERANSARILRASMSEENSILQETMRDQRKSYEERLAAADQYLENMAPIYEQETETARRTRDAQLEYLFSVTNRQKYATKEEREAAKEKLATYIREYNLNEARIKLAQNYLQAEKDVTAAEKELVKAQTPTLINYFNEQRMAAQEIVNSTDEEIKAVAAVLKQYNLASNEEISNYVNAEEAFLNAKAAAYNDQKRIVTMRNNLEYQQTKEAEDQAKARTKAAEDAAKAEAKAAEDAAKAKEEAAREEERARKEKIDGERAVLNSALQSIQLQIASTQEGTQEILDLRIAMIKKQGEIELFENQQKDEKLRQSEEAIKAKYDTLVLRESAKFNTEMAKRDLKAVQERKAAEFDMLDRNERQKTLFRLQQEQARLEAILEIDKTATEKMTDEEVAAIKKTIEKIKKETGRVGYKNMYELLGIKLGSDQQSALNTAIDSVKDSISSLVDTWNQVAEAAVNAADTQVEAARRTLDAEIEARNAGYANDVETAQKELALAQKNRENAIKEQEKAQKAKLAIDSITQASSLITASANIWSSLSGIPIVGPALAIAAIATMWGSFAVSKVKAAQVTKQSEQYGEGTVELLQGGSHASGHDIDLGTKSDGTRRRAEGGEYFAVINKRNSRRFGHIIPDVINAFNDGTFADKYQRANAAMGGYAVGLVGGGNTDVSALERDVAAIREQGDMTQYVDGQGNTIVRYKNLTRKIHKN